MKISRYGNSFFSFFPLFVRRLQGIYIPLLVWCRKCQAWQLLPVSVNWFLSIFLVGFCSGIWQAWCLYWEEKKEECCKGPQIRAISQIPEQWAAKLMVSQVLVAASEVYIRHWSTSPLCTDDCCNFLGFYPLDAPLGMYTISQNVAERESRGERKHIFVDAV